MFGAIESNTQNQAEHHRSVCVKPYALIKPVPSPGTVHSGGLSRPLLPSLQKKEADLLAPIVEKMKKVIERISKEKGLSMVIQSNQNAQIVLYANAESDITEDVIKAFDKEK